MQVGLAVGEEATVRDPHDGAAAVGDEEGRSARDVDREYRPCWEVDAGGGSEGDGGGYLGASGVGRHFFWPPHQVQKGRASCRRIAPRLRGLTMVWQVQRNLSGFPDDDAAFREI